MIDAGKRRVLEARSVKDKIAVAIDCDLLPVGDLNIVAELISQGLIVWIDRANLRHLIAINEETGEVRRGLNADIYQLTPEGIALCEAEGIPQQ